MGRKLPLYQGKKDFGKPKCRQVAPGATSVPLSLPKFLMSQGT